MRFDPHARRRMVERHISEAEVAEALAARETSYPSRRRSQRLVVLGRTAGGRRLKVVVLVADEEFVITVADRDQEG